MRYLLIIMAFLIAVIGWYMFKDIRNQNTIEALTTENNALKSNNDFLEKRIEKEHQNALESSKRKEELEEAVKSSNESCWNRVIPASDPVLIRLHQN